MSRRTELDRAISKHAMWKMHLRAAIDPGKGEWDPDSFSSSNLCDFGKWLHALSDEEKASGDWIKVQALHAEFHSVAAKVLKLALDSHREGQRRAGQRV